MERIKNFILSSKDFITMRSAESEAFIELMGRDTEQKISEGGRLQKLKFSV